MIKYLVLGTAHTHVFGIVGHLNEVADAQVVGVYDDDAARLEKAVKQLQCPGFRSLDEALATRPAVTIVGAPPAQRVFLAEQSVKAGAAVMADKPLALTHQSLNHLIETVKQHKKPVSVYYPYRGQPHVLAAKKALDSGRIGRLVRVMSCGPHKLNSSTRPDWHWTRAGNGGIFVDIGSHHADLCCWLAGQTPSYVCAMHGNLSQPHHPEFQDFGQAQLRFPNGAFAHVEVDWLNPVSMKSFGDTRIWIQGTEGKIEIRLGDEPSVRIWTAKEAGVVLDLLADSSFERWGAQLLKDLSEGRTGCISQDEIWRASRVTLDADASARAGGEPMG